MGKKETAVALVTSVEQDAMVVSTSRRDLAHLLWPITLVIPLLPLAAIGLFTLTGNGIWLWLGPIVVLGVVPVVDALAGLNPSASPDEVIGRLSRDRHYQWQAYVILPLQFVGFLAGMWLIARGGLTLSEQVGMAVTLGFVVVVAFNSAHELGHARESVERWLSKIALAQCGYGHFYTEHNRGHHARVATPGDPTSSRLGESYYAFWVRAVSGSLRGAWRLESRRCERRGRSVLSLRNDVVSSWLLKAALWAVVLVWLGWAVLPFLVIQALVAIALLEAINYLEHYAMLRQRVVRDGREAYEPVRPRHSWNSDSILTHVLLYRLQRHGEHHINEVRRPEVSNDVEQSPVLPTGYAGMILLALVPPLWRTVMDPRVADHYRGDLTLANVQPSQRHHYIPAPNASR